MRILCLIYSIQDPLPASHHPRAPLASPTTTSLSSQAFSSVTSVASMASTHEAPPSDTQIGPSTAPTQRRALEHESPFEEQHTTGLNANQRTPGQNNDWEMADSDWKRLGPDRENTWTREREQYLRESAADK